MTPARLAVAAGGALLLLAVAFALRRDDRAPLLPVGSPRELTSAPGEEGLRLAQNQPNPFRDVTVIIYHIPQQDRVTLTVYNTLGVPVITLVDDVHERGFHQVEWGGRDRNGNRLPGGVYFYQLTAGGRQELRRMVLLP